MTWNCCASFLRAVLSAIHACMSFSALRLGASHRPNWTTCWCCASSMPAVDVLLGPGADEHNRDRAAEDFQIEPQRPIIDVFKVQADPFLEVANVVAAAHLPKAREAGFDAKAAP